MKFNLFRKDGVFPILQEYMQALHRVDLQDSYFWCKQMETGRVEGSECVLTQVPGNVTERDSVCRDEDTAASQISYMYS